HTAALLHGHHNPRSGELPEEKSNQRGQHDERHRSQSSSERLLTIIKLGWRKSDNDPIGQRDKYRDEKRSINYSAGSFKALHLRDNIAEDIGHRKQKESAIGENRPELYPL